MYPSQKKESNQSSLQTKKKQSYEDLKSKVSSNNTSMKNKIALCIDAINPIGTYYNGIFYKPTSSTLSHLGNFFRPRLTSGTLSKVIQLIKEEIIPNITNFIDADILLNKLNEINSDYFNSHKESKKIFMELKENATAILNKFKKDEAIRRTQIEALKNGYDLVELVQSSASIQEKIRYCCGGINPIGKNYGEILYQSVSNSQSIECQWDRIIRLLEEDIIPTIINMSDAEFLVKELDEINENLFVGDDDSINIFKQLKEKASIKLQQVKLNLNIVSAHVKLLNDSLSSWNNPSIIDEIEKKIENNKISMKEKITYCCYWILRNELLFSCCNQMESENKDINSILKLMPESQDNEINSILNLKPENEDYRDGSMFRLKLVAGIITKSVVNTITKKLIPEINSFEDIEFFKIKLSQVDKPSHEFKESFNNIITAISIKKNQLEKFEKEELNKLYKNLNEIMKRHSGDVEKKQEEVYQLKRNEIGLYWKYFYESLSKNFQSEPSFLKLFAELDAAMTLLIDESIKNNNDESLQKIKQVSQEITSYKENNGVPVFSEKMQQHFNIINQLSEIENDITFIRNIFYSSIGSLGIIIDDIAQQFRKNISQRGEERFIDEKNNLTFSEGSKDDSDILINSIKTNRNKVKESRNIIFTGQEDDGFDLPAINFHKNNGENYIASNSDSEPQYKTQANINNNGNKSENLEDFFNEELTGKNNKDKINLINERYPYYYNKDIPLKVSANQKEDIVISLENELKQVKEDKEIFQADENERRTNQKYVIPQKTIDMFLDAINPYGYNKGKMLFTPSANIVSDVMINLLNVNLRSNGPTLKTDPYLKIVVNLFAKMIQQITDAKQIQQLCERLHHDIAFYEEADPLNWKETHDNNFPFCGLINIAKNQWAQIKAKPKAEKKAWEQVLNLRNMHGGKRDVKVEFADYQNALNIYFQKECEDALEKINSRFRQQFPSQPTQNQIYLNRDEYETLCQQFSNLPVDQKIRRCGIELEDAIYQDSSYDLNLIFKFITEKMAKELMASADIKSFIETLSNTRKLLDRHKNSHDANDVASYQKQLKEIMNFFEVKQKCLELFEKELVLKQNEDATMKAQQEGIKNCWEYFIKKIMNDVELLPNSNAAEESTAIEAFKQRLTGLMAVDNLYLIVGKDEIDEITKLQPKNARGSLSESSPFSALLEETKNLLEKANKIEKEAKFDEKIFTSKLRDMFYMDAFQIDVLKIPQAEYKKPIASQSNNNLTCGSRLYSRTTSLPVMPRQTQVPPDNTQKHTWLAPTRRPNQ